MKTRLYLDKRDGTGPYPLRLGITKNGDTAYLTLLVKLWPEQWDQKGQRARVLPKEKWMQGAEVRRYIEKRRADTETLLMRLEADGELFRMSARQIRDRLLAELNGGERRTLLSEAFRRVEAEKSNPRTARIYRTTWDRIEAVMPEAGRMYLEDVTVDWLKRFDREMERTGTHRINARNVHMRNIRAVLNWAVTEELTDNYPFRRYKLRYEDTAKRSLTSAEIRRLAAVECDGFLAEYRDMFLLIFALIGINIADLFALEASDMSGGRIRYRRMKTGTLYDIKVESEAAALIERYRGEKGLLRMRDRYRSARDYTQHLNKGLKQLIEGEPFSSLSTYWARHSWASIAYNELGAPIDTISAALGHKYGSRVTAVYVNPDQQRVDELNRRMMDLVFGGPVTDSITGKSIRGTR